MIARILHIWRHPGCVLAALLLFGWAALQTPLQPVGLAIAALLIGGMVYSMILQRVLGSVPWGSSAADATAIRTGVPRLDRIIEEQRRDIATLSSEMSLSEASRGDIIRRHAMLTDNLAAAVIIRDGQNRITYCSPYTEVLTGYARSEIVGSHEDFMLSIMHEDDHERYHRAMQMVSIGEAYQYRVRIRHKSGIELWIETRSVPIASRGSADASLSIALDVTATVHYQHQVEEKNRDLRDFTYMVSHDLKAPLATMNGMLQILAEEHLQALPSEGQEIVDHLQRAAKRLERLTNSVLEYAKLGSEEVELEPMDIGGVIRDVVDDLSTLVRDSAASITLPRERILVTADRVKLYRIFSNLIANAIKYRDPSRPPELQITTSTIPRRRQCSIMVQDNGRGIPADKLQLIFRPFTRIHLDVEGGSGIGLASVRRLAEQLGGSIGVTSTEGKGSVFTLTLPLADAAAAALAPA